MRDGWSVSYLQGIGLDVQVACPSASSLACGGKEYSSSKAVVHCNGLDSAREFRQAFDEAFTSALTKFDSLESFFASGMLVPAVCDMIGDEIRQDNDFIYLLATPRCEVELLALLKRAVGTAYNEFKKGSGACNAKTSGCKAHNENPLPWASIDAYPEWVVNQIETYASVDPEHQDQARIALETALLENPLCAASIKYDGTCFGKLDTGELVGRRQVLGKCAEQYQQTSTAAASMCNVSALRDTLSGIMGAKLEAVCVWGELMCNPGYYNYKERGLAANWICFGVAAQIDRGVDPSSEPMERLHDKVRRRLAEQGYAYSMSSSGKLRLMVCPALRKLLNDVASCDVVEDRFPGSTHAELVVKGAAELAAGENEGFVVVFTRPDGQTSLRKWKNSSEGASARKKEAQALRDCFDLCSDLVLKEKLDKRIADMVDGLCKVAEASTSPVKKGRSKA